MTTLIVTGSRDLHLVVHRTPVFRILTEAYRQHQFTLVVEGGATGADTLAVQWARTMGLPVNTYMADWSLYGRSAGPRRNVQMLKDNPGAVVYAFPLGKSIGTRHCIKTALSRGHVVVVTEMSLNDC